jgi:hypothetical protein
MSVFASFGGMYYSALIFPQLNQVYEYNVVERTTPKCSYALRGAFHYLLFYHMPYARFPAVLSVGMIMLFKDILFLILHAERRLGKIDELLYADGYPKRIVHLYRDTFTEDIQSRFHHHCFDGNRMYLEQFTVDSGATALAVYNYRCIRRDKKAPRQLTVDEAVTYAASSNRSMFISQRYAFLAPPLLILAWCMSMTQNSSWLHVYINHFVIAVDLLSLFFGSKANDVAVDVSYFLGTAVVLAVV